MTILELERFLQDAIKVEFRPRARYFSLVFNNEYEAEQSYNAICQYFGKKLLVIKLVKKSAEEVEFIIYNNTDFVQIKNLSYSEEELNDFIQKEAVHEKIDLVFVYMEFIGSYTMPNYKNSEKRTGFLNIIRWELS